MPMTDMSATLQQENTPPQVDAPVRRNPPVLILNLFYSGLGIARDLAGGGMRIIGLSAHPQIYGNFSRFCEVRSCANSQEDPERLFDFLMSVAPELEGSIIFPTRDADVVFLDRYRIELEPHFRLAIPPREVLFRVLDKYELVRIADQADVPVPRTARVRCKADLERVPHDVGFPCVVKPVSSVHWRVGDNWSRVGGRKAFRAENFEHLCHEYERLVAVSSDLLIQEMIPGPVSDIVILGGYVDQNSDLLAYFTARKVVQSPEDFGTGCVVESDEIGELLEPTTRLFKALHYQGMAEVEYKRDARDGKYKLIEINTRHWDWHQLGKPSGVNLSWTAYQHLTGRKVVPERKRIRSAKWIAEDAYLEYAAAGIYHREIGLSKIGAELSGRRMYGIFNWKDPWPFWRYAFQVLLPSLLKAVVRKIRGGSATHEVR